jgi:hypothetical protein
MDRNIKPGKRGRLICLCFGFLSFGFTACNLPGAGSTDPAAEATATGGAAQEGELEQPEQLLQKGECPKQRERYVLAYKHFVELNIEKEALGEEVHVEWENAEDAAFDFWIEPSGEVSQKENDGDTVGIDVSGWHTTPSKDCPVNYLLGTWLLRADITGECELGNETLTVHQYFVGTGLEGTCDEPMVIPGISSAPENTLTFNLSKPGSTFVISRGEEGGSLYVKYEYTLYPFNLYVVPLPSP